MNKSQVKFEKMRSSLQKKINKYFEYETQLRHEKAELEGQVRTLQAEVEQQKEWIERLLQYSELSLEDIKKACEKDKAVGDLLKPLVSLAGNYYRRNGG